ncbi:MAG: hypothetical protein HGB31_04510 [Erysipelotrichaceae bacterium]|nr:hypothetical protein [Erysipelotrichaceae bacterium]
MIQKLRLSWIRFMRGRYGDDGLNRFIMVTMYILIFLSLFFRDNTLLYWVILVGFMVHNFRFFSRNISQRRKENNFFLKVVRPLRSRWVVLKKNINDRNHKVFICPQCNGKVRIPKGHGKVAITCPYCRHEFTKRS